MKEKIQTGIGILCILFFIVSLVGYFIKPYEDKHVKYEKIESTTLQEESTVIIVETTEQNEESTAEQEKEETTTIVSSNSIYNGIKYMPTAAKDVDFSKYGRNLMLINNNYKLPENFEWNLVYWTNGNTISIKTLSTPGNEDTVAVDKGAYQPLKELFNAASEAGVPLQMVSAYRSIERQDNLFSKSVDSYVDSGLNKEDAIEKTNKSRMFPGTSEHNVGIGFDILQKGSFYLTENFENTEQFKWLKENAENYGFILRYPKDKTDITGVKYEPWHFRYVGIEHAKKINELNMCLEEYIDYLNQKSQL